MGVCANVVSGTGVVVGVLWWEVDVGVGVGVCASVVSGTGVVVDGVGG